MIKTLPVTYPIITTFPPYADALAILMSHKNSLDWVFSHYIQTYVVDVLSGKAENLRPIMPCFFGDFDNRRLVNTVADCIFLNREMNPFLNIFEVPNTVFAINNKGFQQSIKNAIDQSMYVFGYCDVSQIADYSIKERLAHEIFIYGYDDNARIFYYADFPNNKSFKYKMSTCSFDDVEIAFRMINDFDIPSVKSTALIEYNSNGPFKFEFSYVQESISEYLQPDKEKLRRLEAYIDSFVNTGIFCWETKTYMGVDVYDYLLEVINRAEAEIDLRIVNAFYEHKKMMKARMEYFLEKGLLSSNEKQTIDAYNAVVLGMEVVRNQFIKFKLTCQKEDLKSAEMRLSQIKTLEEELLKSAFGI